MSIDRNKTEETPLESAVKAKAKEWKPESDNTPGDIQSSDTKTKRGIGAKKEKEESLNNKSVN